jgi:hypothetical protein
MIAFKSKGRKDFLCALCTFSGKIHDKNPSKIPAATALPITPATLGPMACMSR